MEEILCSSHRVKDLAGLNALYFLDDPLTDEAKTQLVGHKGLPAEARGPSGSRFGGGVWVAVGDYHSFGDYSGDLHDIDDIEEGLGSLWVLATVEFGLVKASTFFAEGGTLDILDPYWED